MLADFVNVRGGGLLMLGGRRSFAEGGYAGTPLADVMPVVGDGQRRARFDDVLRRSQGRADAAGREPRRRAGRARRRRRRSQRWKTLPTVTSVNRIREVKPGAVVADHRHAGAGRPSGRARRAAARLRAAGARLSALRTRAVGRVPDSGFVELADGSRRRRTTIRRSSASGGRCCAG